MLYVIHFLSILIINFLYSPHYFILVFYTLKEKVKYYILNTKRLVFNFFWLAELVNSMKTNIYGLPTKTHLIRELPQSCEMIAKATDLGLIFCPAKKGTKHDGCLYDPIIGEITETVQFKLKEEGSQVSFFQLSEWVIQYHNLNRLDVGFQSPEDFERNKGTISEIQDFLYCKGFKLVLTSKDYSSYKSEDTCRSDIKDILEMQVSFNKIVEGVNDNMINSFGEIITKSMFF